MFVLDFDDKESELLRREKQSIRLTEFKTLAILLILKPLSGYVAEWAELIEQPPTHFLLVLPSCSLQTFLRRSYLEGRLGYRPRPLY